MTEGLGHRRDLTGRKFIALASAAHEAAGGWLQAG